MPLSDDEVNFETDGMISRISMLFTIINKVVRVILLETVASKSCGNGHKLDRNCIDSFKNHDLFEIKHFGVSNYRLNGEKDLNM